MQELNISSRFVSRVLLFRASIAFVPFARRTGETARNTVAWFNATVRANGLVRDLRSCQIFPVAEIHPEARRLPRYTGKAPDFLVTRLPRVRDNFSATRSATHRTSRSEAWLGKVREPDLSQE